MPSQGASAIVHERELTDSGRAHATRPKVGTNYPITLFDTGVEGIKEAEDRGSSGFTIGVSASSRGDCLNSSLACRNIRVSTSRHQEGYS